MSSTAQVSQADAVTADGGAGVAVAAPSSVELTREVKNENPLRNALADLPGVAERLENGDQFTCYEHARGGKWMVAIGPIGRHMPIATYVGWQDVNLIVDALRHAAGQAPLMSHAFDTSEYGDE